MNTRSDEQQRGLCYGYPVTYTGIYITEPYCYSGRSSLLRYTIESLGVTQLNEQPVQKESYPHDPSSSGSIVTEGALLEARHFLGARSVWRGKIPTFPDMDILVPLITPPYHMLKSKKIPSLFRRNIRVVALESTRTL